MSVTVFVNGHDDLKPADLLQLTFFVSNDVLGKLFEAMTPEERQFWQRERAPEVISPDGIEVFTKSGVLNFYLKGVPERLYKLLEWHLTDKLHDAEIPYGKSFFDKSKMFGCDTLRVPITQIPEVDSAPVMVITASSANLLMESLGFSSLFNGYGYDNVPVADLITRASEVDFNDYCTSMGDSGGTRVMESVFETDSLNDLCDGLVTLAKWALDHGYDSLTIA